MFTDPRLEAKTIAELLPRPDLADLDAARALLADLPDSDARDTLLRLVRGAEVYINRHRMEQLSLF